MKCEEKKGDPLQEQSTAAITEPVSLIELHPEVLVHEYNFFYAYRNYLLLRNRLKSLLLIRVQSYCE